MDNITHSDDDNEVPSAVQLPAPEQAPTTDLWSGVDEGDGEAQPGAPRTEPSSSNDEAVTDAAAETAPAPSAPGTRRRAALLVSGGVLLAAALGSTGFVIGHDVDRGTVRSSSGSFPNFQFPSGNFTNPFGNSSGNGSNDPFGNGFDDPFGNSPSVTTPTLPAHSPSSAAAAKIAAQVDVSVVDITTSSSYSSSSAAGTGMILSSKGLILTNNHVIDGATSISVRVVATGRTYSAKVLGYSVSDDVALLQLEGASGLTPITTADSSQVTAHEGVVGIGNAGGVGGTPSFAPGAVVATDQSVTASDSSNLTGSEKLTGMIQVAAAIEAGDSGGPLVNTKGQVIGMDTAGSSTGSTMEINGEYVSNTQGFAIPINRALAIARTIEAGTSTTSVHVGATPIMGIEITSTLSRGPNSGVAGVRIAGLAPGTPAATSGLAVGDVITAVNSHAVSTPAALSAIVQQLAPGDSVRVSYTTSAGDKKTLSLNLIAGPAL